MAPLLLPSLLGCSAEDSGDAFAPPSTPSPADAARLVELRIDMVPARLRDSEDSTTYRVLPQSLLPGKVRTNSSVNMGEVSLVEPVVQSGLIEAFRVNPYISSVPGTTLPLDGTVGLRRLDTIQWYSTQTNELGGFETWSVPGTYRLEVVPKDPLLPVFTSDWTIEDPPAPIVLDLGAGVPIYGQVLSELGPESDMRLYAEDPFGARTASAETDEFGRYQLRVTPGQWTLVCEGRSTGKDPALRFPTLEVGEAGLNLDVNYPSELPSAFLEGQVQGPSGEPLVDASIRIVADSLADFEDYEGAQASWSFELASNDTGSFVSPIVPGVFTIEVTPPEGEALTPYRLPGVVVGRTLTTTLETIRLGEFRTIEGTIRGPNGAGLGDARVDCSEVGFDGRIWEAFTAQGGAFELDVPDVTLECQADPPGDRDDLARQWRTVLPSVEEPDASVNFELSVGQRVTGKVMAGGAPEAYVVVEVLDLTGRSLGSGLTLEDGAFSIAVDLLSAQESEP
jgi:hypothetical protein